ncbi:copper amine oxidase N-terminal domain-containing protein [Paenibacillus thermotolerans]|uniref:copper amine oxidase N-terminal domain-containing protein n=1 Tax=Paenibacillus thermotolerans TaxID=3027807 RepID=UPI002368E9C9|nr:MULTISPECIES: copper amine oxidase N-terminal domain-containing protein [unclassified Paenibacillus]
MKLGKRFWLAAILVVSMLAMAGCESVGGVNLNEALVSSINHDSSEGTFQLQWEFIRDESQKPDEETEKMLQTFGSGKLRLDELKSESATSASAKGTLTIPRGTVPFEMFVNGTTVVIDAEGAKKPFLFDTNPASGGQDFVTGIEEAGILGTFLEPGSEANKAVSKAVLTFFLRNAPNPKQIQASAVTETLNGQQAQLTKISLEVGAQELTELAIQLLQNIAKDEEGLKQLIGSLYDALKPMLEEMNEQAEEPDEMLTMALNNKTLAVEFFYEAMKPVLTDLAAELEKPEVDASEVGALFGDDTKLQLDVLLSGTTPVGYDLNAVISPAETESTDGIKAFRIGASARQWNLDGDVKADAYNGEVYEWKADVKPRERLANLEPGSVLYELLKKDLKATTHTFVLATGDDPRVTDGFSPYLKGVGTTMVPVRYVSEELDTVVTWDGKAQTVTVKDEVENITIVLTIGSKQATVNGKTVALTEAPERIEGTTFVPFAFIVKALGGTAQWDSEGFLTITKEF